MRALEVMETADDPGDESRESLKASLRRSLQEAKAGHRLPFSQMWEGMGASCFCKDCHPHPPFPPSPMKGEGGNGG